MTTFNFVSECYLNKYNLFKAGFIKNDMHKDRSNNKK